MHRAPDSISNAIGYAKFYSRSRHTVIRVCDEAGNMISTHEHAGNCNPAVSASIAPGLSE
jgi:hypothetical protein